MPGSGGVALDPGGGHRKVACVVLGFCSMPDAGGPSPDQVTPNIWPSNSPQSKLLDYDVWGIAKRETNQSPGNTKEEGLSPKIKSFPQLNWAAAEKTCSIFPRHLEAVVEANTNFIE